VTSSPLDCVKLDQRFDGIIVVLVGRKTHQYDAPCKPLFQEWYDVVWLQTVQFLSLFIVAKDLCDDGSASNL